LKLPLRRKIVFAVLALALMAGAGVAVAATQSSSSPRQRYLDDVAHRLGVSPSALSSAMQAAMIDRIEEAVAAGRISKAQAESLKQRIKEGKGPLAGARFGRAPALGTGTARAVESYLGLSGATIRADREAGKSLAQIAESTPGKSVQGLREAIEAAIRTRLSSAVSKGRITKGQQEEALRALSPRVEALIHRTGIGPFGRHGGMGPYGYLRGGAAPSGPPPAGLRAY
jgi:hypothetical protein